MGYANLPGGKRMEYNDYITKSVEWKKKRESRIAFDDWQCAVCHKPVNDMFMVQTHQVHHLDYSHLGNEDMVHDLITMCEECHKKFHVNWQRPPFWEAGGGGSPLEHWKEYSLQNTAKLCYECARKDYWFGGQYNLCNLDVINGFIDLYFIEHDDQVGNVIFEEDVMLYFRNKRYEIILQNADNHVDMETFLDEHFGKKGIKGGNKDRAAARSFYTKHKICAIKRIYKENENITILMDEVKKLEENNHE